MKNIMFFCILLTILNVGCTTKMYKDELKVERKVNRRNKLNNCYIKYIESENIRFKICYPGFAFCISDSAFLELIKHKNCPYDIKNCDSCIMPSLYLSSYVINKPNCTGIWGYNWKGNIISVIPHIYYELLYYDGTNIYLPKYNDTTLNLRFFDSIVVNEVKFENEQQLNYVKEKFKNGYVYY